MTKKTSYEMVEAVAVDRGGVGLAVFLTWVGDSPVVADGVGQKERNRLRSRRNADLRFMFGGASPWISLFVVRSPWCPHTGT